MADKDLAEFISSREAQSTTWYLDAKTPEIVVTRCESCEAEARHTVEQLANEFSFVHRPGCSHTPVANDERSRNDRALDLVARVAVVLDSEPDQELVLSALALLSAVTCELASQDSGESLQETANRFICLFRDGLPAAASLRTDRPIRSFGGPH
jgi:hypothetical protein